MLVQVCLLLLSVGVYVSYADSSESTTEDALFEELEVFPEDFLSRFPQEAEFFRTKILVYLFFNLFSKYFAEKEPIKFWSKFNQNNFNRVAIDAVFYEYLTKFTDRKMKHLVFNPLESSTSSSTEDIAIDRIGDYLDNLSATEVPADQSETLSQATNIADYKEHGIDCVVIHIRDPSFGVAGKDFPHHCDIPKTSFNCANKLIPGVYADIEADCQVFHVCWPNRIDSFLCPIGTTFNQASLTCDFWHESGCPSSLQLFDHSLLAKGKTPRSKKPTAGMDDESVTTSDVEVEELSELEIPEYDGTCQSLISKPLQLRMKFLPAKCKVRVLRKSPPGTIDKSRKYEGARINELVQLTDALSRVFRDALEFIVKETERGTRFQQVAKRLELKEKQIPKSDPRVMEATTEFASMHEETDATSEEQTQHSTTELPSENFSPSKNSNFAENHAFETTSQETVKARSSTPLKPSKLSEDSKEHVLDVMLKTLELGGNILSGDVLPFMEKMILNSPRKLSKSKTS